LSPAKIVTVEGPVVAQAMHAAMQLRASLRQMHFAILVTKIAARVLANLLPMAPYAGPAQEFATLKKYAVDPPLPAQRMLLLQMEHRVAPENLSLVPLVNALPVTYNAKPLWVPIPKETTLTLVPRMVAKSLALLPNSALMFAIPCNRISSTVPHVKAEENVTTANVKAPALERRLRVGYITTKH